MAKVEIKITKDDGSTVYVTKDIPEGTLEDFNSIEDLTLTIRREMFPQVQSDLLKQSQTAFKKK